MGKCKSKKLFFRLIFIYYKEQAFKDLIMRFLPMVGMTVCFFVKAWDKTIFSLAKKSFYPPIYIL